MLLLLATLMASPAHAAPGSSAQAAPGSSAPAEPAASAPQDYTSALEASRDDLLEILAKDEGMPNKVRLQAALILLERQRTREVAPAEPAAAPTAEAVPEAVAQGQEPNVVEVPAEGPDAGAAEDLPPGASAIVAGTPGVQPLVPLAGREDLACDKDGRVVPRVPPGGFATLANLAVSIQGDVVLVRGQLEGNAGRPLHYLLEGGSATYPSRYVVSMLGVRSGLGRRALPVESDLVESVEVIEREGAIIVVVNSVEERPLRANFQQNSDHFVIALELARLPGA